MLSAQGRERLAQMLRLGVRGHEDHDDVEGVSTDRSLTLTVDATGWVQDVRVDDIERLRTPDDLARGLNEAYGVGDLQRGMKAMEFRQFSDAEKERGLAIMEGRAPVRVNYRPAPRRVPTADMTPPVVTSVTHAHDRRPAALRGSSRERELTIVAKFPKGYSEVAVDASWLSTTTGELLRYALREAFDDAYKKGEW